MFILLILSEKYSSSYKIIPFHPGRGNLGMGFHSHK